MEVLAQEAGVTKPILYRHFGHREGLILALASRFAANLLAELGAALARQAPPRELITTTIDAYIGFIERDTPLYRFLTQWAHSEHPRAVTGLMAEVSAQITRVIEANLTGAGLDPTPAATWAHGLVGMVHVAGDWWVAERAIPRARLVEDLTQLLWSGMASYDRTGPQRPDPRA